jgi:hypothetical protein
MIGVVVGGAYYLYKMNGDKLPNIPLMYLSPTKMADYPIPGETNRFPDPPASQDPQLPPLDTGVCNVVDRPGFEAWSGHLIPARVNDVDFGSILAGERAYAGCFSPPNKS